MSGQISKNKDLDKEHNIGFSAPRPYHRRVLQQSSSCFKLFKLFKKNSREGEKRQLPNLSAHILRTYKNSYKGFYFGWQPDLASLQHWAAFDYFTLRVVTCWTIRGKFILVFIKE